MTGMSPSCCSLRGNPVAATAFPQGLKEMNKTRLRLVSGANLNRRNKTMKHLALALLVSATALGAASARADTRVSIGVNLGTPHYRTPAPVVVYAPPAPRGYWKEIVVKTWIPERLVVSHGRRGRPVRHVEPGYFTYRTDRVWVAANNHRDYRGYGYGRDDNRDRRGDWNR